MPRVPTGKRKYNIQHMWQHHHEILRLSLLGFKNKEIAVKLGCTPQTISNTLNSPLAKAKMNKMREERDRSSTDVASAIKDMSGDAVNVMKDLLTKEGVKDEVRFRAAADTLDRNGHAAPKVVENKHLHAHLDHDDIEDIKSRAINQAKQSGLIQDAELVEEENG